MDQVSRKKSLFGTFLSGLMTLFLLFAVFSEITLTDFLTILARTSSSLLAVYICLNLVSIVLRARRSQLMVDTLQEDVPPLSAFLMITAVRNAFVDLLPGRIGELAYVYLLNRLGVTFVVGLSTFLLAIALDVMVLLALVAVAAKVYAVSLIAGNHYSSLALVVAIALLLFTFIFWIARRARGIAAAIGSLLEWFAKRSQPRLAAALRASAEATSKAADHLQSARNRGSLGLLIAYTCALRILKYGSLYVLLIAVSSQWGLAISQIPLMPSVLAFIFAEAAATLPVSGLMGFGAYEAVWAYFFGQACGGACGEINVGVLALTIHVITQAVGYIIGFLALLTFFILERRKGPKR